MITRCESIRIPTPRIGALFVVDSHQLYSDNAVLGKRRGVSELLRTRMLQSMHALAYRPPRKK